VERRSDQKPVVPPGFEVNLFASGLAGPRTLRTAPNGDIFVAESSAGRVSVLRPGGSAAAKPAVFASGLHYPFRIAAIRPGPIRNGSILGTPIAFFAFRIATAISPRAAPPK
jgi:glucose/arabinose dehydrogenase